LAGLFLSVICVLREVSAEKRKVAERDKESVLSKQKTLSCNMFVFSWYALQIWLASL